MKFETGAGSLSKIESEPSEKEKTERLLEDLLRMHDVSVQRMKDYEIPSEEKDIDYELGKDSIKIGHDRKHHNYLLYKRRPDKMVYVREKRNGGKRYDIDFHVSLDPTPKEKTDQIYLSYPEAGNITITFEHNRAEIIDYNARGPAKIVDEGVLVKSYEQSSWDYFWWKYITTVVDSNNKFKEFLQRLKETGDDKTKKWAEQMLTSDIVVEDANIFIEELKEDFKLVGAKLEFFPDTDKRLKCTFEEVIKNKQRPPYKLVPHADIQKDLEFIVSRMSKNWHELEKYVYKPKPAPERRPANPYR